jgi:lipopolysaccharide transport system ATP-binding protein
MSSDLVVSVQALEKSYKILNTPKAQLLNFLGMSVPLKPVLKGLNFEIRKGEKVGILGVNGAGKSTLLNIIAGMSKPTSGSIEVNGKIGAILELGAGFHPDLSGRQNAEMILALRGVAKRVISETLPHIHEFSELGVDFEAKIRTYSSGMLVRLAFATACAITPDLFIVDEALAVGDARFQQKCFDFLLNRMAEGTLLLISHDMSAISAICDRVIILNDGFVAFDGHPSKGIPAYNKIAQGKGRNALSASVPGWLDELKSGPCDIDIVDARLLVDGEDVRGTRGGDVVTFEMDLENNLDRAAIVAGFTIVDTRGQKIFGQTTSNTRLVEINPGRSKLRMQLFWPKIAPGKYSVTLGVGLGRHESMQSIQCWINNCFEIEHILDEVTHGLFNATLTKIELE